MNSLHRISRVALCALTLAIGAAPSCTALPVGETMIVLQTDLSLPKDVDRVTIQALVRGDQRHFSSFEKLGSEGELQIPASIGLTLGDGTDPTTPVTFRVTAFQKGKARVLREVITTIPQDRLVALKLPIQWLCWEDNLQVEQVDGQDHAISNCPESQTCIAGTCADSTVDPATLDDYSADAVFGGGTGKNNDGACFDTTGCFDGRPGTPVVTDAAVTDTGTECLIKSTADVNVAIRADTAGICGATGCYVPLDAKSDLGWQPSGENLKLPYAVCARIKSKQASGVSTVAASTACPLKTDSIPTCGPWSSAGKAPPAAADVGPITLAANQAKPVALAVFGASVYWTVAGDYDQPTGLVMQVPVDGGGKTLVAGKLGYPRDIALAHKTDSNNKQKVTDLVWATAGYTPSGMTKTVDPLVTDRSFATKLLGEDVPLKFDTALVTPEGVAVSSLGVFFTDIGAQSVYRVDTSGMTLLAGPTNGFTQKNPYRIALDDANVYWTNEGDLDTGTGSIAVYNSMSALPSELISAQNTPRNFVVETGADLKAKTIYWANYGVFKSTPMIMTDTTHSEKVMMASVADPATLVELADGHRPSGIAVDSTAGVVYWSNEGDNTIWSVNVADKKLKLIAQNQNAPGAIAVDAGYIYWVNTGSKAQLGSVMRISKNAPAAVPTKP